MGRIDAYVSTSSDVLETALAQMAIVDSKLADHFCSILDEIWADRDSPSIEHLNLMILSNKIVENNDILKLLQEHNESSRAYQVAAASYYKKSNMISCCMSLEEAFYLDVVGTLHWVVSCFSGPFSVAFIACPDLLNSLSVWLDGQAIDVKGLLVPPWPSEEAQKIVENTRNTAIAAELPAVLLVTQPKSGSVAVGSILQSGFRLPTLVYGMHIVRLWI